MTERRYFEDVQPGQTFDLGSRDVTADEIVAFAAAYDPQPFHLDPERARDSIYGGLIASGWQTAGFYMRLLVDGLINATVSQGSPGVDELRWLKPVRPGDRLRGRFTVLETTPSRSRPEIGIIRARGELFNQRDEVVMTVISVGFFGRRPASPS